MKMDYEAERKITVTAEVLSGRIQQPGPCSPTTLYAGEAGAHMQPVATL